MTIFRSKKNGKLYTIELLTRTGHSATPYKHTEEIHPHRKRLADKRMCVLENFVAVAEK